VLAKLRARLTYANVMATVAVFIALGGSSYAALTVTGKNVRNSSLTGKDIKNSSLTTRDVKNRSLLARDFKAGQLPAGPKGDKGDTGVARVVVRTTTLPLSIGGNITVPCSPGERAVGGGAERTNGSTQAGDSVRGTAPFRDDAPAQPGVTPNQWQTGFFTMTEATSLTWYVVCASP
jgi:hypothetical protein